MGLARICFIVLVCFGGSRAAIRAVVRFVGMHLIMGEGGREKWNGTEWRMGGGWGLCFAIIEVNWSGEQKGSSLKAV